MDIVSLAVVLLKVIDLLAATGVGIPSCQRGASLREQQMRRGFNHKCYRGPAKNQILRGRGFVNITTGSFLTCAGICLRNDACKSFNFCLGEKRCELNSAVFLQNMAELMFAKDCVYFDEDFHVPEAKVECLSPEPLGLEDRTIPDEHISASSFSRDRKAYCARLNDPQNHWSTDSPEGSWIKVDLVDRTVVAGVITQGISSTRQRRVTQYKVAYMKSATSAFEHVTTATGDIEVFVGNVNDKDTPVTNMFHQSIIATAVRIEPVAWIDKVSMRLELLGCRLH